MSPPAGLRTFAPSDSWQTLGLATPRPVARSAGLPAVNWANQPVATTSYSSALSLLGSATTT